MTSLPAQTTDLLPSRLPRVANQAPRMGPNVNETLKAMPTRARDLARSASDETSLMMAMASWTFPSLNPPTIRLTRYGPKLGERSQMAAERTLPAMVASRTGRRP